MMGNSAGSTATSYARTRMNESPRTPMENNFRSAKSARNDAGSAAEVPDDAADDAGDAAGAGASIERGFSSTKRASAMTARTPGNHAAEIAWGGEGPGYTQA